MALGDDLNEFFSLRIFAFRCVSAVKKLVNSINRRGTQSHAELKEAHDPRLYSVPLYGEVGWLGLAKPTRPR